MKPGCICDIVCFSGLSGSGKTTLINSIVERYDGIILPNGSPLSLRKARRFTTRDPRPDDDPVENMYIVADDESSDPEERFSQKLKKLDSMLFNGEIISAYVSQNSGHAYGWSKEELFPRSDNEIVFVTVNDADGAVDLKIDYGATSILVDVPRDITIQRIMQRGGTPEQIQGRIDKLDSDIPEERYDAWGGKHVLRYYQKFLGIPGIMHGIADLIVANNGNKKDIADAVFQCMFMIADYKRSTHVVPPQFMVSLTEDGFDSQMTRMPILLDDKGVPVANIPNELNAESSVDPGYDRTVTLMHVVPLYGAPEHYAARISPAGSPVDMQRLRKGYFRGCRLEEVQSWNLEGEMAPLLVDTLVNNGFMFARPQLDDHLDYNAEPFSDVASYHAPDDMSKEEVTSVVVNSLRK